MGLLKELERLKTVPDGQFSPLADGISVYEDTEWQKSKQVPVLIVRTSTWASFDEERLEMTPERRKFLEEHGGRYGGYSTPEIVEVVERLVS